MRQLLLISVAFVCLLVPVAVLAGGGDGGFDGVVHSIEGRYHVRATRIPMLGLISFICGRASHGGVSGLHVAEFENFSGSVDGEELNRMVEEKMGAGWERTIRETSRYGNSQTLIFVHPEGGKMGMLVLDLDGHELDVVQISVDPDHLNESLRHYEHRHRDWERDGKESD